MGTHMQNKISMDVAADSSSLNSLSFSGLVCIQDQQSKSPPNRAYQNNKDDQEFEFVSGTSPHNLKNSHPDMVISDSHLLPLEFLLKSGQSQAAKKPGNKQLRPASPGSSKMPIGNHANHSKDSHRSNRKVINQVKKGSTSSRSWFGQKLFQSFVSPCRECHAVRPTMKAHTVPQESTKLN
ncbi:hypothetical protein QQP08_018872 [Theobroma cacao]|nr:hypothetical protein QQP08_018872 [Theobroma cacao]